MKLIYVFILLIIPLNNNNKVNVKYFIVYTSKYNINLEEDLKNIFMKCFGEKIIFLKQNANYSSNDNKYYFIINYIDNFSINILFENYYYLKNNDKKIIENDLLLLNYENVKIKGNNIKTSKSDLIIIYEQKNFSFIYFILILIAFTIFNNIRLKKFQNDI